MTELISTWSWRAADWLLLGRLVSLVLVLTLSLVIFFRTETVWFNLLIVLAVGGSTISAAFAHQRLPVLLTGLILIIHTGLFLFLTTDIPSWLATGLTAITAAALAGTTLSRRFSTVDLIVITGLTGATLIATLILPTSLIVLTVIVALPLTVIIPLLVDREQPLSSLLVHATVTGIIGGGLVAATAALFT